MPEGRRGGALGHDRGRAAEGEPRRPYPGHRTDPVARLLAEHPSIGFIGCNGTKSHAQLKRSAPELFAEARLTIVQLPSTSPAAAALRFEEKLAAWRAVGDFLQKSGDPD